MTTKPKPKRRKAREVWMHREETMYGRRWMECIDKSPCEYAVHFREVLPRKKRGGR